jgi:F-type H+-transporting ATPase subunit epsilon
MADTFQLEVATPERLLVDEQVAEAQLPGKNGYMGVLAGHAPLLSALGAGLLSYNGGDSGAQTLVIAGGFVEISDNHVRVLADSADLPQDIQEDEARKALEAASEELKKAQTEEESNKALESIQQAQAKLDGVHGQTSQS